MFPGNIIGFLFFLSDRYQTIRYIEAAENIDDFAPWKRREKRKKEMVIWVFSMRAKTSLGR